MKPEEAVELELSYASLNKNIFDRLVKELLLVHFYRVEIYNNKKGLKDEYFREHHGSPGNLWNFENLIFNSSNSDEVFSNFLVSVQVISAGQLNVSINTSSCLQLKKVLEICRIWKRLELVLTSEF